MAGIVAADTSDAPHILYKAKQPAPVQIGTQYVSFDHLSEYTVASKDLGTCVWAHLDSDYLQGFRFRIMTNRPRETTRRSGARSGFVMMGDDNEVKKIRGWRFILHIARCCTELGYRHRNGYKSELSKTLKGGGILIPAGATRDTGAYKDSPRNLEEVHVSSFALNVFERAAELKLLDLHDAREAMLDFGFNTANEDKRLIFSDADDEKLRSKLASEALYSENSRSLQDTSLILNGELAVSLAAVLHTIANDPAKLAQVDTSATSALWARPPFSVDGAASHATSGRSSSAATNLHLLSSKYTAARFLVDDFRKFYLHLSTASVDKTDGRRFIQRLVGNLQKRLRNEDFVKLLKRNRYGVFNTSLTTETERNSFVTYFVYAWIYSHWMKQELIDFRKSCYQARTHVIEAEVYSVRLKNFTKQGVTGSLFYKTMTGSLSSIDLLEKHPTWYAKYIWSNQARAALNSKQMPGPSSAFKKVQAASQDYIIASMFPADDVAAVWNVWIFVCESMLKSIQNKSPDTISDDAQFTILYKRTKKDDKETLKDTGEEDLGGEQADRRDQAELHEEALALKQQTKRSDRHKQQDTAESSDDDDFDDGVSESESDSSFDEDDDDQSADDSGDSGNSDDEQQDPSSRTTRSTKSKKEAETSKIDALQQTSEDVLASRVKALRDERRKNVVARQKLHLENCIGLDVQIWIEEFCSDAQANSQKVAFDNFADLFPKSLTHYIARSQNRLRHADKGNLDNFSSLFYSQIMAPFVPDNTNFHSTKVMGWPYAMGRIWSIALRQRRLFIENKVKQTITNLRYENFGVDNNVVRARADTLAQSTTTSTHAWTLIQQCWKQLSERYSVSQMSMDVSDMNAMTVSEKAISLEPHNQSVELQLHGPLLHPTEYTFACKLVLLRLSRDLQASFEHVIKVNTARAAQFETADNNLQSMLQEPWSADASYALKNIDLDAVIRAQVVAHFRSSRLVLHDPVTFTKLFDIDFVYNLLQQFVPVLNVIRETDLPEFRMMGQLPSCPQHIADLKNDIASGQHFVCKPREFLISLSDDDTRYYEYLCNLRNTALQYLKCMNLLSEPERKSMVEKASTLAVASDASKASSLQEQLEDMINMFHEFDEQCQKARHFLFDTVSKFRFITVDEMHGVFTQDNNFNPNWQTLQQQVEDELAMRDVSASDATSETKDLKVLFLANKCLESMSADEQLCVAKLLLSFRVRKLKNMLVAQLKENEQPHKMRGFLENRAQKKKSGEPLFESSQERKRVKTTTQYKSLLFEPTLQVFPELNKSKVPKTVPSGLRVVKLLRELHRYCLQQYLLTQNEANKPSFSKTNDAFKNHGPFISCNYVFMAKHLRSKTTDVSFEVPLGQQSEDSTKGVQDYLTRLQTKLPLKSKQKEITAPAIYKHFTKLRDISTENKDKPEHMPYIARPIGQFVTLTHGENRHSVMPFDWGQFRDEPGSVSLEMRLTNARGVENEWTQYSDECWRSLLWSYFHQDLTYNGQENVSNTNLLFINGLPKRPVLWSYGETFHNVLRVAQEQALKEARTAAVIQAAILASQTQNSTKTLSVQAVVDQPSSSSESSEDSDDGEAGAPIPKEIKRKAATPVVRTGPRVKNNTEVLRLHTELKGRMNRSSNDHGLQLTQVTASFAEALRLLHSQMPSDNRSIDEHLRIWTKDPTDIVNIFDGLSSLVQSPFSNIVIAKTGVSLTSAMSEDAQDLAAVLMEVLKKYAGCMQPRVQELYDGSGDKDTARIKERMKRKYRLQQDLQTGDIDLASLLQCLIQSASAYCGQQLLIREALEDAMVEDDSHARNIQTITDNLTQNKAVFDFVVSRLNGRLHFLRYVEEKIGRNVANVLSLDTDGSDAAATQFCMITDVIELQSRRHSRNPYGGTQQIQWTPFKSELVFKVCVVQVRNKGAEQDTMSDVYAESVLDASGVALLKEQTKTNKDRIQKSIRDDRRKAALLNTLSNLEAMLDSLGDKEVVIVAPKCPPNMDRATSDTTQYFYAPSRYTDKLEASSKVMVDDVGMELHEHRGVIGCTSTVDETASEATPTQMKLYWPENEGMPYRWMTLQALQLIERRSYYGPKESRVETSYRLNWRAAWNLFNVTRIGHIVCLHNAKKIMKQVQSLFAEISKPSGSKRLRLVEFFQWGRHKKLEKQFNNMVITDKTEFNEHLDALKHWVFPLRQDSQDFDAVANTVNRKNDVSITDQISNLMKILDTIPAGNQPLLNLIFKELGANSRTVDSPAAGASTAQNAIGSEQWWRDVFQRWKETRNTASQNASARYEKLFTDPRRQQLEKLWNSLSEQGLENYYRGQISAFGSEVSSSESALLDSLFTPTSQSESMEPTRFSAKNELSYLFEVVLHDKNMLNLLMAKLQLAKLLKVAKVPNYDSDKVAVLQRSINDLIKNGKTQQRILQHRIEQVENSAATVIDKLRWRVPDSRRDSENEESFGASRREAPAVGNATSNQEIFAQTDKAIKSLYRDFESTEYKILQNSVTTYKLLIDAQFKLSLIEAAFEKRDAELEGKRANAPDHSETQAHELQVAQSTIFTQFYKPHFLPALLQHVKTICASPIWVQTEGGLLEIDLLIEGGSDSFLFQQYADNFCVKIPRKVIRGAGQDHAVPEYETDYALLKRVHECMAMEAALTNQYLQKNLIDNMWNNVSDAHSALLHEGEAVGTNDVKAQQDLAASTKKWIQRHFDTTNIHSSAFTKANVSWDSVSGDSSHDYMSWFALQNKKNLATFLQCYTEKQFQSRALTPQQCFWPRDTFLMLPTGERLDASICVNKSGLARSNTGFVGDMFLLLLQAVAQLQLWFSSFSVRQFEMKLDVGDPLQALTKVELDFETTTEYCDTLKTSLFSAYTDVGCYFGVFNNSYTQLYNYFFTVQNLLGSEIASQIDDKMSGSRVDESGANVPKQQIRRHVFQIIDVIDATALCEKTGDNNTEVLQEIIQKLFVMHTDNLFATAFCAQFDPSNAQKNVTTVQSNSNTVSKTVRIAFENTADHLLEDTNIENANFAVFEQMIELSCPSTKANDSGQNSAAINKAVSRYHNYPYSFSLPNLHRMEINVPNDDFTTFFENKLTLVILQYHFAYRQYLEMAVDYSSCLAEQDSAKASLNTLRQRARQNNVMKAQEAINKLAMQAELIKKFLLEQHQYLLSLKKNIQTEIDSKNSEIQTFLQTKPEENPYRQALLGVGVEFKRWTPKLADSSFVSGITRLVTENTK